MTNKLAHLLLPRWRKFAFRAVTLGAVDRADIHA